jgi:hypothetical protein
MDEMSQGATASYRPHLSTTEKDQIKKEVLDISDRAASRIKDNDDKEFKKYVEAIVK